MPRDPLLGWLASPHARDTLTRAVRLTPTQFDILYLALTREDPWQYTELAETLGLERQHVHQTLQKLERRDLIAVEAVFRRYRAHAGPALKLLLPPRQSTD